ncbi:hypothetical protein BH09ACT8_BH09ACT8_66410 [soil metagenome]
MTYFDTSTAVGCAAAGLALALVVAGCSRSGDSSSETSSSAMSSTMATSAAASASSEAPTSDAAEPDYYSLLMKAEDIPPTPAGPFTGDEPKLDTAKPLDVSQNFHTADNSATIFAQVIVDTDPAAAAGGLEVAKSKMGESVVGAPTPLPSVTPDAMAASGTSLDGSKAATLVVFSEENTVVQLAFISAPGDLNPVPPDYVEQVGGIQRDAIKQALPELSG